VCTCARVCAGCSLALLDESAKIQLVHTGHFLLAWVVIFDKRIDRSVVCVFFILWRGVDVCVCVCVCVYAHTHTHTLHVGYSTWAQVCDGHLESWKNPNRLKRCIHVDSYMCTEYICLHICWAARWWFGLTTVFFLAYSFYWKKKKMWRHFNQQTSVTHFGKINRIRAPREFYTKLLHISLWATIKQSSFIQPTRPETYKTKPAKQHASV